MNRLICFDLESLGWVRLKAWVIDKAMAEGVTEGAIYMRLHRGEYPNVEKVRVNHRIVYVKEVST